MTSTLDVLFDGQRQKVLGWLLLHPERSVHVRELARQTATHAGSLHRELSRLADAGLLVRRQQGNQVTYQADRTSPIHEELASIFRKTTGLASIIRDAMVPLGASVACAFIYGSFARGTPHANSDIDLFVVGDLDYVTLVSTLHECQQVLMREINPTLYSAAEFQQKLLGADAFIREVIAQPKLTVLGELPATG
jgi:predicted nucleotidyltransferase/DNA-binding HxlR family transcriptional regulator